MGVTVFFGMLGVTLFGLIFTPVFYVLIRGLFCHPLERRFAFSWTFRGRQAQTATAPVASREGDEGAP